MKIVCITESRAEYGVMRELFKKMDKDKFFELHLIVTGMHLSKRHGHTIDEIKKDGFKIHIAINPDFIYKKLKHINPDLVIVVGDREPMLKAAVAASYLSIPIAHISGGDVTTGATIDEKIRHALTKFADIHFPATENSAKNLIKMGENLDYIFEVGNPGISTYYKSKKITGSGPLILIIQHPTNQSNIAGEQMRETMEAIKYLGYQSIIIYPNSDDGSKDMIKVINEYKSLDFIKIYKSIPRDQFINLMASASVIIGNSSCALLEAPSFNLPAVNIGDRQKGRERSDNVVDVSYNRDNIILAIKIALKMKIKSKNPYAKSNPEDRIIKILKKVNLRQAQKEKFRRFLR